MTEERFGELIGSIAWALVSDATQDERIEVLERWDDVKSGMLLGIAVAEGMLAAKPAVREMLEEARATFGNLSAVQLATRLRPTSN